jgi:hypothetical protein
MPVLDIHVSIACTGCEEYGLLGLFTRGSPLRILMIGTLTGAAVPSAVSMTLSKSWLFG